MSLSPAATIVLTRAADRPDRRLEFHRKLPTGGRHKMIDAMLRDGLIAESQGDYRLGDGALLIENSATGLMLTTLALTDAGFRDLNLDPPKDATTATAPHSGLQESVGVEPGTSASGDDSALYGPQNAAVGMVRPNLRDASLMVLDAWLHRDAQPDNLATAMDLLRLAMTAKPGQTGANNGQRKPRQGTKQQAVLTLLRQPEGTNIAQIVAATAWAQHTVRGFLANLKRKGITVEVLERVRQVGPGSAGTMGSYSIYRIASAA